MGIDAHAALAPSSAHIWAPDNGCRASVRMQQQFPSPEDTEEAREGTAAHWYATELLSGRDVTVGAVAPNGYPINAEMVDCAQGLLADVRDTIKAAAPGYALFVEERVHMPIVSDSNWGTPDVVLVDPATKRAHIWDYKYGHRFVDALRNWQLIDYAVGVLLRAGVNFEELLPSPTSLHGWRVTLNIAQPRNYHPIGPIREWGLSGCEVRDYALEMRKAAFEALAPGAPYQTGDHCRDCSARHACPALQRAGALAMDVAMAGVPVELPPHALGLELRQLADAEKRIKARRTGLEEQAMGLLRSGGTVPFCGAEYATSQERWTAPIGEVIAMGDMMGVDLRKDPAAITPNQARKAGIDASVIKAYAERPRGALKLVMVDDDAAQLAFQ